MSSSRRVRVLLTNDDGPPGPESPFIFGFAQQLQKTLGWDVRVVVPSSQKSWIGKAFHIKEDVQGRYYYPREPDGLGETSLASRPLKDGEVAEWILFDGTPATCANIALHNLYKAEVDLVISGPNLGRNTSSAFSLSSGTIGAALSGALSNVRSIALSYGIFLKHTPRELHAPAHDLSVSIVRHLWEAWGTTALPPAELYSINIPMIEALTGPEPLKVCWTRMWHSRYGRLFASHPPVSSAAEQETIGSTPEGTPEPLLFKFAPDFKGLVNPQLEDLPVGTDAWAVHSGHVSVTPLIACFAEPQDALTECTDAQDTEKLVWKVKL
ncbi:sure-like protein [Exidia glandulosa HHB12029]|uniref:Sure-like protein n=1 Tax=Exidia glandulosa HHB12029 TaxID=1314781 RepID=A0A165PN37_EXIGL|nr:sure-like protein [Exidia glandulosa HHB12029]